MTSLFNPKLTVDEIEGVLLGYRNIEEFTEGGQGCIFKALSNEGISVAIKIYHPDQTLIRAELEVQKLAKIHSPYIVQLLENGHLDIRGRQAFFTVTRFEEGEDLRRILRRRSILTELEVRDLITHICSVIDHLWQAKVVHCDIKPENILQGSDACFRLVDLGLAKHLDSKTITQYGLTMGTLGYMAPEQMLGRKNYTLRVDLFALGIVAYESLTGVHPFGKNQMVIASEQASVEPPSSMVDVTLDLERAIMKMLQRNPLFRPKSGSDVIAIIGG